MTSQVPDTETVRTLGSAVATQDHDSLEDTQLEALTELTDEIEKALDDGAATSAADALLAFWVGHLGASLAVDSNATPTQTLIEDGFAADTIGVDLYQALDKLASATDSDGETPDQEGWARRLAELTNRHVAHLKSHQDGT